MKRQLFYLFVTSILFSSCSTNNYLKNCESILLKTEQNKIAEFSFEEKFNTLGHNFEPWETSKYTGKGIFQINDNTFIKEDTLTNSRGKNYFSKTDYRDNVLLYVDHGDTELLPITEDMYYEKIINTARYSPAIILQYFIQNKGETNIKTSKKQAIYSSKIGIYPIKLFINLNTNLVDKISYLSYDELYGDVTTSFIYSSYKNEKGLNYPSAIKIEKINGKVIDEVNILAMKIAANNATLLVKPLGYQLAEPKEESEPQIKITKHNDYIHFMDLIHTDDKVMIVELDDYLFIAEAPINAKNGELIIAEAKKIAPSKPIKYFAFGHHHPHYLGGVRAFVHQEATVLCTDVSRDYVEYIANAPHTLQPDNLQLEPKEIKTQVISDSLILGENNQLKIYSIGEKSDHTKDYLLYYFPQEKLLFQDDLCWIPKEGAITKARGRQMGLYNSIQELNIEVDTIIQSWPVKDYGVKTVIPFVDLEESVRLK